MYTCRLRREKATEEADNLSGNLSPSFNRAMLLAREKGASSWLTVLPIDEFNFALHKSAFRVALTLR